MSGAAATALKGSCTALGRARVSVVGGRWPLRMPTVKLNASPPAEAAEIYQALGLAPLPIRRKDKRPAHSDWKDLVAAKAYSPNFYADDSNLALALGPQSRDLADVDIDSDDPNVPLLAAEFLPATVTFGRDGRRASHRLYECPGAVTADLWLEGGRGQPAGRGRGAHERRDEPKRQHVEIRGAGLITVVPPGIHHTDQRIRFESGTDRVAEISAEALRVGVGKVVAGAVLAHAWPERGARHEFRLAIAGALLGAGWSQEDTRNFLLAVGRLVDDDATDLAATIRTSAERDGRTTGWPTVAKRLQSYDTALGTTSGEQAAKLIRDALFPVERSGESATGADDADSSYVAQPDGMYLRRGHGKNSGRLRLTNFTARIVADVAADDGAEVRHVFEIEAKRGERSARLSVGAERFASLSWVAEALGGSWTVYAGHGIKDHARVAIQELSQDAIATRTEYRHTGWREVNDEWVYLHAGGAIGRHGLVEGVSVALPHQLASFVIPPARDAEHLKAAVRAAWGLVDLLKGELITLAAQASVWRSVLPLACTFGLYVSGRTGVYKSQVAALAQQHFGSGFTAANLPANFSSTANSLEALAFNAKNALLVVDDFAPSGSELDVRRYYALFDRLYRAQGNGAGRGRSMPDGRLQVAKPPRGLILGTGEDVPPRHSSVARAYVIEVEHGMIEGAGLTRAQGLARDGLFATAMGGFLAWLAGRFEKVRREAEQRVAELRTKATADDQHRRTPDTVAHLAWGWELFGEFARDVGAVTDGQNVERQERVWRVLVEGAKGQAAHHAAADPTVLYVELIKSALMSGAAHVADAHTGLAPRGDAVASAGGWRRLSAFADQQAWMCLGQQIGWVDQERGELLLDPGAAYKVASEMGRSGGKSLPSDRTLRRRLKERGVLSATGSEARETVTVRRRVEGVRRVEVLVLDLATVFDLDPGSGDAPRPQRPAAVRGAHDDDMPF